MTDCFDLVVVGGGVNGCGIARDAAGRGLSVLLVEADDLGGATSSASSKLIHGGLRYLETFEFRLVHEALVERRRLLACAPHLVEPIHFALPHDGAIRSALTLRLGLTLYSVLAGGDALAATRALSLRDTAIGAPLRAEFVRGFLYSDCRVDDARLVVLTALDACERGAEIRTRTRLVRGRRADGLWAIDLQDAQGEQRILSRALVNAAGPWAGDVLKQRLDRPTKRRMRLVEGGHLVFPRLYQGDHAYILQTADRRVVFVIPFAEDFTLVGTTERRFDGDPRRATMSEDEEQYLCACVNRCFSRAVHPRDAVWRFSGVRPLWQEDGVRRSADPRTTTRDYALELDTQEGAAPLLSVFGGKITTFRRLAERATDALARWFPQAGPAWTAAACLPGGDLPDGPFERFVERLMQEKPFLERRLALRLARAYGTRAHRVLGAAKALADLGRDFGGGLTEAEIGYLRAHEWASTAEDILWRRSKLGLILDPAAQHELDRYLRG